jgi:predicted dehydrogenase
MKTIRWGMIGCGEVAEIKSGPGFYKASNSTLVAVMRRNGACAQAKVPLWVGYYRRALPRFLAVRDLIERGTIGEVRMVVTRQFQKPPSPAVLKDDAVPWRVDPALSGGGFFFEGVCHTLDFLDFVFGRIVSVRSFATNKAHAYRAEDTVVASYRFAAGVHGSGTWCYAADFEEEYNEIVGSAGRIRFSTYTPVPIVITRGGTSEELAVADPPHVHQPMIQSIVDELNGVGRCPSTGDSASRTAWVQDEILREFRAEAGTAPQ